MKATQRSIGVAFALVMTAALGAPKARAATITIIDVDSPGLGLNDPTPTAPVGGNPGTTLGVQRRNAMQYAADVWGAVLDSPVEIRVATTFDDLPCGSTSAVIGSTGTNTVHRDFIGAPVHSTWYPAALANSIAGVDLAPGTDDMTATFNAAIGTTCALGATFYYGFDGQAPAGHIDLVSVALHEFGHGLGFATFVSQSGVKLSGLDDAFMRNLEDHRTLKLFPAMTDAERASASVATGNLHWVGAFGDALSGMLGAGVGPADHIHMYAPSAYQIGSSVSHVDTALVPNEMMEPSYTGPDHDVTLTLEFLEDVGWRVASDPGTPTATTPTDPLPTPTHPMPTATPTPVAAVVSCNPAPLSGCRRSDVPGKDTFAIVDSTDDERDAISWNWAPDAVTTKADFGEPTLTDGYALCIYDGGAQLVMEADAPAGGTCGTKPCWTESAGGFRYVDKARTPSGIDLIILRSGAMPGRARITVRGKGPFLATPALPLTPPVTVQLTNARGTCWEARYDAPASSNTAGPPGRFRDKAD